MSRDLRLDYYDSSDNTLERLRIKLQGNVEKLQIIIDSLTGVEPAEWSPVLRNGSVSFNPAAELTLGNPIQIGGGWIRYNQTTQWLEYNHGGEDWYKLPKGTPKDGYIPVWKKSSQGPLWSLFDSAFDYKTVSTPYTLLVDDKVVYFDASLESLDVRLMDPNTVPGEVFYLKKIDTTTNVVAINGDTFNIDRSTTTTLTIPDQCKIIQSIGTAWRLIGGYP